MKNKIKYLALAGLTSLALSGCISMPKYRYTTIEGCGITQWPREWAEKNVQSMSWTGFCERGLDNRGLAERNGTFVIKLKNGKQLHYVGWMTDGKIWGKGTRTDEDGWKYVGEFQSFSFTQGRIYNADGRLLFEGSMADNVMYDGKNLTYKDQRYHKGKIYFADGSYIDDARFTGSAGLYKGTSSIDPTTGRGIVYGKYVKGGHVVYRYVEGRRYGDDHTYEQAKNQYEDNLRAAQAEAEARQKAADEAAYKEMKERNAQRNREGLAMLRNATVSASSGRTGAERRQLAVQSFSPPTSGAGVSTTSSSGGACGYDQAMNEFLDRHPKNPSWGSRDLYQYAYFIGTEGLKILQKYKSCLSSAVYDENYNMLLGGRDSGLKGCRQLSSDGGNNCVPKYP